MPFVTDTDVAALHQAVQSERSLLGMAVLSCRSSLDAMTLAQWDDLNARIGVYLGDSPSLLRAASQMDQGQALQREMQPWHARLRAAGCSNVPDAPPAPPADLLGTLAGMAPLILLAFLVHELR